VQGNPVAVAIFEMRDETIGANADFGHERFAAACMNPCQRAVNIINSQIN
jgi:hypothetical protein